MASVSDWQSAPCAAEIELGFEHNDGTEHAEFHRVKRKGQVTMHREIADLQGRLRDHLSATVEGETAQRLIEAHDRAKRFHDRVADGHMAKASGYATATGIYMHILAKKRDLIIEAQRKIDEVQRSKAPAIAKATQREEIINLAREQLAFSYNEAMSNMAEVGNSLLQATGRGGSIQDHVQPLGSGALRGPQPTGGPRPFIRPSSYGVEWSDPVRNPPTPDIGNVAGQLVATPPPAVSAPSTPATPVTPGAPAPRVSAPIASAAPGGVGGGPGRLPIPSGGGASVVSAALSGVARAVPPVVAPVVVAPHIAAPPVLDHGGLVAHAAPTPPAPVPAATAPAVPASPPVAAAPMTPMTPDHPPHTPLPPYGSDVRMVASTSPASPPVAPPAGPLVGSATAAPLVGPSAVVRTVAAVAPAPVSGGQSGAGVVAGQAGAAAAGGLAGGVAAEVAEQARVDGFAAAMGAQEPRLRWVAATQPNGATVVATDLGGGWVPPGVRVPRGADLPAPGSVVSLRDVIRGSAFHAEFTPGQDAAAGGLGGVDLSDAPRRLAPVLDRGWQLRQATQWRDGLPRLAHTLAAAWAKGGGARPVELEELAGALAAQRQVVLDAYGRGDGEVNAHELGNWMLLAAIDAVHGDRLMLADYHLRWFGTTTDPTPPSGDVMPCPGPLPPSDPPFHFPSLPPGGAPAPPHPKLPLPPLPPDLPEEKSRPNRCPPDSGWAEANV